MLTVINTDAVAGMKTLRSASVHCIVTSPPYWGLRNYGTPELHFPAVTFTPVAGLPDVTIPEWTGHLGLEPAPWAFVGHMVALFREAARVLRKDGTLWLNFGDSYSNETVGPRTGGNLAAWKNGGARDPDVGEPGITRKSGLPKKNMVGIPWRVAFALQADGWILRQDIIWSKPNPMPESVTDRCTKAHEYFFLLTRAPHYFYDAEAVKEQSTLNESDGNEDGTQRRESHARGDFEGKNTEPGKEAFRAITSTRNRRSVWDLPSAPFKGAHFATFPPDLIKPCILAGTSARGACPTCGAQWTRLMERGAANEAQQRACGGNADGEYHGQAVKEYAGTGAQNASDVKARILAGMTERITTGWQPGCKCEPQEPVPCMVLDMFGGSGTTGAVALELSRHATLIELNPKYIPMIHKRCTVTPGLALC